MIRRDSASLVAVGVTSSPNAAVAGLLGASVFAAGLVTIQVARRRHKAVDRCIAEKEEETESNPESAESSNGSLPSSPSLEPTAPPPPATDPPPPATDPQFQLDASAHELKESQETPALPSPPESAPLTPHSAERHARRLRRVSKLGVPLSFLPETDDVHLQEDVTGSCAKRIRRRAKRIICNALCSYIERRRAEQASKAAEASKLARQEAKHAKRKRRAAARHIQQCARRMIARRAVARLLSRPDEQVRPREKGSGRREAEEDTDSLQSQLALILGVQVPTAEAAAQLATATSDGGAVAGAGGEDPAIAMAADQFAAQGHILMDASGSGFEEPSFLYGERAPVLSSPVWDHSAAAGLPPPRVCAANVEAYASPDEISKARHEVRCLALYKTTECMTWVEGAGCPYGHKCRFRHPNEPLRPRLTKQQFYLATWECIVRDRWLAKSLAKDGVEQA